MAVLRDDAEARHERTGEFRRETHRQDLLAPARVEHLAAVDAASLRVGHLQAHQSRVDALVEGQHDRTRRAFQYLPFPRLRAQQLGVAESGDG